MNTIAILLALFIVGGVIALALWVVRRVLGDNEMDEETHRRIMENYNQDDKHMFL